MRSSSEPELRQDPLANARKDADDFAQMMTDLGHDAHVYFDLTLDNMREIVQRTAGRLSPEKGSYSITPDTVLSATTKTGSFRLIANRTTTTRLNDNRSRCVRLSRRLIRRAFALRFSTLAAATPSVVSRGEMVREASESSILPTIRWKGILSATPPHHGRRLPTESPGRTACSLEHSSGISPRVERRSATS